jgi:hypothetical protein
MFFFAFAIGVITYFILKLWRRWVQSNFFQLIIYIVLSIAYFYWFLYWFIHFVVDDTSRNYYLGYFCLAGFLTASAKKIFLGISFFAYELEYVMKQIEYIASKILAIIQIAKNIALMFQSKEKQSHSYSNNEKPNTGNTSGGWRSNNQNRKAQEEQAKREEEMNAYRREQKRKEEEQKAKQNQQNKNREQSQQYQDINETKRRSYEEVLGLKTGWTQEDLRDAYKREAQRTHPDKWTGKPPHIQKIMEEEYKAVQEAYNKLKK